MALNTHPRMVYTAATFPDLRSKLSLSSWRSTYQAFITYLNAHLSDSLATQIANADSIRAHTYALACQVGEISGVNVTPTFSTWGDALSAYQNKAVADLIAATTYDFSTAPSNSLYIRNDYFHNLALSYDWILGLESNGGLTTQQIATIDSFFATWAEYIYQNKGRLWVNGTHTPDASWSSGVMEIWTPWIYMLPVWGHGNQTAAAQSMMDLFSDLFENGTIYDRFNWYSNLGGGESEITYYLFFHPVKFLINMHELAVASGKDYVAGQSGEYSGQYVKNFVKYLIYVMTPWDYTILQKWGWTHAVEGFLNDHGNEVLWMLSGMMKTKFPEYAGLNKWFYNNGYSAATEQTYSRIWKILMHDDEGVTSTSPADVSGVGYHNYCPSIGGLFIRSGYDSGAADTSIAIMAPPFRLSAHSWTGPSGGKTNCYVLGFDILKHGYLIHNRRDNRQYGSENSIFRYLDPNTPLDGGFAASANDHAYTLAETIDESNRFSNTAIPYSDDDLKTYAHSADMSLCYRSSLCDKHIRNYIVFIGSGPTKNDYVITHDKATGHYQPLRKIWRAYFSYKAKCDGTGSDDGWNLDSSGHWSVSDATYLHISNKNWGVSDPYQHLKVNPCPPVHAQGRCFIKPIFPAGSRMSLIGGPGYNLVSDDGLQSSSPQTYFRDYGAYNCGGYHVSIEPPNNTSLTDTFLVVCQASYDGEDTAAIVSMDPIDITGFEGVHIKDADGSRIAIFGGSFDGILEHSVSYTITGAIATSRHCIMGLDPTSTYTVALGGTPIHTGMVVENGCLVFDSISEAATQVYTITVDGIPTPPTVPNPPRNLLGVYGDTTATLTWDAPAGGVSESYSVYQDGVLIESDVEDLGYVVTGLTNGVEYAFTVRNVVEETESVDSNSVLVTPNEAPAKRMRFRRIFAKRMRFRRI
jgi:hypothetical protein